MVATVELPKGYMVRIRLTSGLMFSHPDCAYCNEPLDEGTVIFIDTISLHFYHLKNCRRDAVREVVKREHLTPSEIVRRFGVDRPAAFRIVEEVRINGRF